MREYLRLIITFVLFSGFSLNFEAKEVVYTVVSKESVSSTGAVPAFSGVTFKNTSSGTDNFQITAKNSMSLTLNGFGNKTVRSIKLYMKSNTSSGAGSFSMTCGNETLAMIDACGFNDPRWNGKYSSSYTYKTIPIDNYSVKNGDVLNVIITASINSLYCKSFTIDYDDSPAAVGSPTISVPNGIYFEEQTVTIAPPTDGTAQGVYYTLDGSDPRLGDGNRVDIAESHTLKVSSSTTIWAVAYNDDGEYSELCSSILNVLIPTRSYSAALVAPLGAKYYALAVGGDSGLETVAVYAANGKVVNASESMRDSLTWHIYELGDTAYIRSSNGKFLSGGTSQSLKLDSILFAWDLDSVIGTWTKSSRSFICKNNSGVVSFSNYDVTNIGKSTYQSDFTKPYSFADGYVRTGTIAYRLGTICLPCDVSDKDYSGVTFFEISGVVKKSPDMSVDDITGIALTPVKDLKAGVPYLFQATTTSNNITMAYSGERVSEARIGIGLIGNLSNENITIGESDANHWNYVLSANRLCKLATGGNAVISPNRAYIDLCGVPVFNMGSASAKTIIVDTDRATGISETIDECVEGKSLFNVQGILQPSSANKNGIYILGGNKYYVGNKLK